VRLAGGSAGRGRRALDGGDDAAWRELRWEQAGVGGSACRRRCPVAAAPSAGGAGVSAQGRIGGRGGAGHRGRMGGRGGAGCRGGGIDMFVVRGRKK
jgi:hypothetical protein